MISFDCKFYISYLHEYNVDFHVLNKHETAMNK